MPTTAEIAASKEARQSPRLLACWKFAEIGHATRYQLLCEWTAWRLKGVNPHT